MAKKEIVVKCSACKKEFNYYSSEFRPFCSDKCKNVDLGLWLTESYTVGSSEPLSEADVEVVLREHSRGEQELDH